MKFKHIFSSHQSNMKLAFSWGKRKKKKEKKRLFGMRNPELDTAKECKDHKNGIWAWLYSYG